MDSQVVLITGCSTGIGRAAAIALVQAGYEVVATARKPEELEGIGAAMALRLDVEDEESIASAVKAVYERYGKIDILINNAGYALRGAVEELDIEAVKRMFDVNVNGIIRMVKYVAPMMRMHGSGRIINIGSIGGRLSAPANGAYTATKYAVEALNDAMRWELGAFGIGVVLIEPGNIKTGFMETAIRSSGPLLTSIASPYAALYAGFAKATDALRINEPGPETVARVILQAIRAKKPRARYQAAVPHATRITASLPDRGKDYIMRRFYGLGPSGLAQPKK